MTDEQLAAYERGRGLLQQMRGLLAPPAANDRARADGAAQAKILLAKADAELAKSGVQFDPWLFEGDCDALVEWPEATAEAVRALRAAAGLERHQHHISRFQPQ